MSDQSRERGGELLEDVSFLLPFSYDCEQRLINLRAVTAWMVRNFEGRVFVGGHDLDVLDSVAIDRAVVRVAVTRDPDGAWRPGVVRNALAAAAITEILTRSGAPSPRARTAVPEALGRRPEERTSQARRIVSEALSDLAPNAILALWDVDVWCAPGQVHEAAGHIGGGAAFAYPYDGTFVHVTPEVSRLATTGGEPALGHVVAPEHILAQHPGESFGGAVLFNAAVYVDGGGENTAMVGWGPDDRERHWRFARRHRAARVHGPLYHIEHDRPYERYHGNANFDLDGRLRIEVSDRLQLPASPPAPETCPVCRTAPA